MLCYVMLCYVMLCSNTLLFRGGNVASTYTRREAGKLDTDQFVGQVWLILHSPVLHTAQINALLTMTCWCQRKYGTALRGAIMVEFSSVSVKYLTSRSKFSPKHMIPATFPHL